jgi:hypothetical protein
MVQHKWLSNMSHYTGEGLEVAMITVKIPSVDRKSIGFSLYALLGLYALLYNPTLLFTGTGVVKPLMVIGVMVLIIRGLSNGTLGVTLTQLKGLKVSKTSVFLLVYLALVLLGGQLIALFGGGDEQLSQIFLTVFTALIPLTYVMVRFLPKSCNPVLSLIAMTALVGTLQAIFIFLDWSYPDARAFFSSIVIQPKTIEESFRAAGFTSITGDGLSFSQALCGGCAFYLALASAESRARLFWLACFTLVFFSLMPVARTGIIILFFFMIIFLAFYEGRLKSLKIILTFLIFIAIALAIVALVLNTDKLSLFFETVVPYAFEFVFNYFGGEGFRSASTDDLATMFVLPNNLGTWLFGDGYFMEGEGINYMGTDIGYLRIIFYVGLVGSFLIYSWFLMIAYVCLRECPYIIGRIFFVALFGSILIANIKFPFVLQNVAIGFSLLFLFVTQIGSSRYKIAQRVA